MVKEIIEKIRLNLKQLIANKKSKSASKIIKRKKLHYNEYGFPSYCPLIEKKKDSSKHDLKD